MGREATCTCEYDGATYHVKALVESSELILRGELRKHISRSKISSVRVVDGCLHCAADGVTMSLALGDALALKWQAVLLTAPPSLAQKLGITASTSVQVFGAIDDGGLHDALLAGAQTSPETGDVIVARVDEAAELQAVLKASAARLKKKVPLWIIYPKGAGHPLTEDAIRLLLRSHALIDTKVASVSTRLTGLRFVHK